MGVFEAVAFERVDRSTLSGWLVSKGMAFHEVAHVGATASLARAIRGAGALAIPVATLLDLVQLPTDGAGRRVTIADFPSPALLFEQEDDFPYMRALRRWQSAATGVRMRTAIRVEDSLRTFLRQRGNSPEATALLASRRQYSKTVQTLVQAGVEPGGLSSADPLAELAARAWEQAEVDVPELAVARDVLWADFEGFDAQETPEAAELAGRIRGALAAAYGRKDRWVLLHHGFYFYTPQQWALFQLLRRMPDVDQYFVVHDDGRTPVFATWKQWFRPEWAMPTPTTLVRSDGVNPGASAFSALLTGHRAAEVAGVEVVECGSPADLVRMWAAEEPPTDVAPGDEAPETARFAPRAADLRRLVQRLGSLRQASPRLLDLPVGHYLLGIHACVRQGVGGKTTVDLSPETFLDLAASGLVDDEDGQPVRTAVVRRVLPYFRGCRDGAQWRERANSLCEAVGERRSYGTDEARMLGVSYDPVRLVPWGDISAAEAAAVRAMVHRVVDAAEEMAGAGRIDVDAHLGRLFTRVRNALTVLPAEEREVFEERLRGFRSPVEVDVDVTGLVDVVALLLGRAVEFEDENDVDLEDGDTAVLELRALDALGFERVEGDLHLANLSEDVFPSSPRAVGWPFSVDDLRESPDAVDPITVDLLAHRSASAALSDLYLFWLALDGVAPGRRVRLSWVSKDARELKRPSPVLTLLTVPDVSSEAVRAVAGGVPVTSVDANKTGLLLRPAPVPAPAERPEEYLAAALLRVPHPAAASAAVCPRRFALQWALGPTVSFGPEYMHGQLAGNLRNQAEKDARSRGRDVAEAVRGIDLFWPHLTPGQRESSRVGAPIQPGDPSARPEFVWTLRGNQKGSNPLDRAYQAAYSGQARPDAEEVVPEGLRFLPRGTDDHELCKVCPVQARCSQWVSAEEGRLREAEQTRND